MDTTRESLLVRVKDPRDDRAWREFRDIYAPLLYAYARARGLSRHDAEEVRDQCLAAVTRGIGTFKYDKEKGGFKRWLRRIADNKVVDLLRKHAEPIANSRDVRALRDPGPSPDEAWERHWRYEHLKYCVEQVRGAVSEVNFRAFEMLLFEERSVKEVCERLGITANQVYQTKARILRRVRAALADVDADISQ